MSVRDPAKGAVCTHDWETTLTQTLQTSRSVESASSSVFLLVPGCGGQSHNAQVVPT